MGSNDLGSHRYTARALNPTGEQNAAGSHSSDQRSWLVSVNSPDSKVCVGPQPGVESPVHSGPPPPRRGRDRLEGERRAMGPRWIRRGGASGRGWGAVQAPWTWHGGERTRATGVGQVGTHPRHRQGRSGTRWRTRPWERWSSRDEVGGMSRQTPK